MKNSIKLSSYIPKTFFALLLMFVLSSCVGGQQRRADVREGARSVNSYGQVPYPATVVAEELSPTKFESSSEVKVALLAPLSGRAEKLGKSFLDAARLGLVTEGSRGVKLVPYDTKGTIEGAAEAATLAMQDAPDMILGPLFSDEVRVVMPIARAGAVPVLAFSNDSSVAGNGVYLIGLSPSQQVERLVEFSSASGVRGYAATQPINVLGNEVVRALQSAASREGKEVYFKEGYSTYSTPNYDEIASKVAREYSKQGVLNRNRYALVIPESGGELKRLVSSLGRNGITTDDVRFLGTSSWDNSATYTMSELNNAWYSAVPYSNMNSFMVNFQENFGYRPAQLASLAYDGILLAAELGREGLRGGAITNPQGFYGANGSYRFLSNGMSERGYDIVEINRGRITVVDFAPTSF